ncbi:uncharacterized protein LOC129751983 [Uranotaenia lowii]|uniref:uncharacterized protein LOC129751983 n=1 Tax=Uranotaenia lowii TaxID=190385 RepID=UPI002479FA88|nr:uncharacterized protein LOC129751983 [Uranotaenia lowii]
MAVRFEYSRSLSILVCVVAFFKTANTQSLFPNQQFLTGNSFSYGIFAPVGWTVGAYSWYIASLGLILGAIVLLYFAKGWNAGSFETGGFFNRSPYYYYQRAFDDSLLDLNGLSEISDEDIKRYLIDKIEVIEHKLSSFG